jgi:hypothetical protein
MAQRPLRPCPRTERVMDGVDSKGRPKWRTIVCRICGGKGFTA